MSGSVNCPPNPIANSQSLKGVTGYAEQPVYSVLMLTRFVDVNVSPLLGNCFNTAAVGGLKNSGMQM